MFILAAMKNTENTLCIKNFRKKEKAIQENE